jgi:hypothetical protein
MTTNVEELIATLELKSASSSPGLHDSTIPQSVTPNSTLDAFKTVSLNARIPFVEYKFADLENNPIFVGSVLDM